MWNNAYFWVKNLQTTQEREAHTLAHFVTLSWNTPLSQYGLRGVSTLALPQFLCHNRINMEALDFMVHFLSKRMIAPSNTLVAQLYFSRFILTINTEDTLFSSSPPHAKRGPPMG